jgi:anti-anti-sigma factor
MPTARLRVDVAIRGRLDVTTEADLRAEITAVLDAQRAPGEDFVVDLTGVETVDIVGVGLLVGVHRQAERRDRRLVLTGVPPRVLRLLAATRLRRVLTVREVPRPATVAVGTAAAGTAGSEQPRTGVVGAA